MDANYGACLNPDVTAKKSMFDEEHLLVKEIFLTVQGEMPFAGRPALFIRLGGCNRGNKQWCRNCDTDFRMEFSKKCTPEGLLDLALSLYVLVSPHPLIVITGGEPLLQEPALKRFLSLLNRETYAHVQFETNGDYDGRELNSLSFLPGSNDLTVSFVVSPKEPFTKRPWFIKYNGKISSTELYTPPNPHNFYIRRIISADVGSKYYEIPKYLMDLTMEHRERVYLSGLTIYGPSGNIDLEQTKRHAQYAATQAIYYGFNVSWQSHAYLGIR